MTSIGETRGEILAHLARQPYGRRVYASGKTEDILRDLVREGLVYEDGQGFYVAPRENAVHGEAWTFPKLLLLAIAGWGAVLTVISPLLLPLLWWAAGGRTFEIALHVVGVSASLMWALVVLWGFVKTR